MSKLAKLLSSKKAQKAENNTQQNEESKNVINSLTKSLETSSISGSSSNTQAQTQTRAPAVPSKLMSKLSQLQKRKQQEQQEKHASLASETKNSQSNSKVNDTANLFSQFRKRRLNSQPTTPIIDSKSSLNTEPVPKATPLSPIPHNTPSPPDRHNSQCSTSCYDHSIQTPDASMYMSPPSSFAKCLCFDIHKPPKDNIVIPYSRSALLGFHAPSPDDIVLAAQSKSKAFQKTANKAAVGGAAQKPKEDVKLSIEEITRHAKPVIHIGIFGDVGAGKKSLLSRFLYQIGGLDTKHAQKCRLLNSRQCTMESILSQSNDWYNFETFASSCSTTLLSYSELDLNACSRRLFPLDMGVFVLRPHPTDTELQHICEVVRVLDVLQIRLFVFIITGMDIVDWSESAFTETCQLLQQAIQKQCKQSIPATQFVPTSALNGENLTSLSQGKLRKWYRSGTVLSVLDELCESLAPQKKALNKEPLRASLESIQLEKTGESIGEVNATALIHSGILQQDMPFYLGAGKLACTVTTTHSITNSSHAFGVSGERVRLSFTLSSNCPPVGSFISGDYAVTHSSRVLYFQGIALQPWMSMDVHTMDLFVCGYHCKARLSIMSTERESTQQEDGPLELFKAEILDQPIVACTSSTLLSMSRIIAGNVDDHTVNVIGFITSML
ncbi:ski complex interacting GTPase [Schizosaccharomyces japonicus yFS275]|uniref:Ski complex interacting GTPase n=1 Tax=Schizosaccharomyces japonicus (strain yFS275 / FY16936) TaxID=402676 RepID=B6JV26_SCHJY|nr:ski complex interacting GTPase [Schizosaccharomyces japonicus yFS275]EEB05227.1 ski complex interacting GTPase [Schizosaccharomyces japonicus yFS275]